MVISIAVAEAESSTDWYTCQSGRDTSTWPETWTSVSCGRWRDAPRYHALGIRIRGQWRRPVAVCSPHDQRQEEAEQDLVDAHVDDGVRVTVAIYDARMTLKVVRGQAWRGVGPGIDTGGA